MSSINFKQQELIDESVNEYIRTYDKIAQQYLNVRKQIITLAAEASQKAQLSSEDALAVQKLRFELDNVWLAYSQHLDSLYTTLTISKDVPSVYMDDLNSKYEQLLTKKLTVMKQLKNIKEVQVPLIEEMKQLHNSFAKSVNKSTARRFHTKEAFGKELSNPSKNSVDLKSLVFSRAQLDSLFKDFDEEVRDLKTVYDVDGDSGKNRTIKASYYIDKELEAAEKYMAVDNDQYLFKVAGATYQDPYLAKASIAQYDELNDQLTKQIIELINNTTHTRAKWHQNAKKVEQFRDIVQDVEMED